MVAHFKMKDTSIDNKRAGKITIGDKFYVECFGKIREATLMSGEITNNGNTKINLEVMIHKDEIK